MRQLALFELYPVPPGVFGAYLENQPRETTQEAIAVGGGVGGTYWHLHIVPEVCDGARATAGKRERVSQLLRWH